MASDAMKRELSLALPSNDDNQPINSINGKPNGDCWCSNRRRRARVQGDDTRHFGIINVVYCFDKDNDVAR
jgi:hypothetical protein